MVLKEKGKKDNIGTSIASMTTPVTAEKVTIFMGENKNFQE